MITLGGPFNKNGAVHDRKDRANQRRRRLEMPYASLLKQTH
jgi:hypothetical protein